MPTTVWVPPQALSWIIYQIESGCRSPLGGTGDGSRILTTGEWPRLCWAQALTRPCARRAAGAGEGAWAQLNRIAPQRRPGLPAEAKQLAIAVDTITR